MQLLSHVIYEIKKGVRHFALLSVSPSELPLIERRLAREAMDFHVADNGKTRFLVFLGDEDCVEVARRLGDRLEGLSAERDFMLGALLGYDIRQQSRRYLRRSGKAVAQPWSA